MANFRYLLEQTLDGVRKCDECGIPMELSAETFVECRRRYHTCKHGLI